MQTDAADVPAVPAATAAPTWEGRLGLCVRDYGVWALRVARPCLGSEQEF